MKTAVDNTETERTKALRLRRMKLVALGMLLAMAVVYWWTLRFPPTLVWVAYVNAFAEAAMVGALADWFAVTALFRHPLGIPIPHTAIVPRRKDEIAGSLGSFVREHFLDEDSLRQHLRDAQIAHRLSRWLASADNSRRVTEHASSLVSWILDVVRDQGVQEFAEKAFLDRLRKVEVAPLLGQFLEMLTRHGHHQELLSQGIQLAAELLEENRERIRLRIKEESPWWVPGFIDDDIYRKLVERIEATLIAMAIDPDHELRQRFDLAVDEFIAQLRESDDYREFGETLKTDLLGNPAVRNYAAGLWEETETSLRNQLEDPDSPLRTAFAGALERFAADLLEDPVMQERVESWLEDGVVYVVVRNRDAIAQLIPATVSNWDADVTARRIELQVGRDLQFIRINGTVVGGLVGITIHWLSGLAH